MSSLLDQLNLRPQERRLVVAVAAVVFIILNVWLVWPHFDDWRRVIAERDRAERTAIAYKKEIEKIPEYEAQLRELESDETYVIPQEQELNLALAVQNLSRVAGLHVPVSTPRPNLNKGKTNQFFEEQALEIQISSGNEELIQFLVSLASTNSLIRVQNLNLKPGAGGTRLDGRMTLVASYQKKPPLTSTTTTPGTNTAPAGKTPPAAKPPVSSGFNPSPRVRGSTINSAAFSPKSEVVFEQTSTVGQL